MRARFRAAEVVNSRKAAAGLQARTAPGHLSTLAHRRRPPFHSSKQRPWQPAVLGTAGMACLHAPHMHISQCEHKPVQQPTSTSREYEKRQARCKHPATYTLRM